MVVSCVGNFEIDIMEGKLICYSRRDLYVCTSFVKGDLLDLYINDLADHYTIKDLKIRAEPLDSILGPDVSDTSGRILRYIKNADIIIAFIENYDYHYAETLSEIGMATALNKPVVIFDSSVELREDGDIPGKAIKGNAYIKTMPIYNSKNIIHTTSWSETKNILYKIRKFIKRVEDDSDSD